MTCFCDAPVLINTRYKVRTRYQYLVSPGLCFCVVCYFVLCSSRMMFLYLPSPLHLTVHKRREHCAVPGMHHCLEFTWADYYSGFPRIKARSAGQVWRFSKSQVGRVGAGQKIIQYSRVGSGRVTFIRSDPWEIIRPDRQKASDLTRSDPWEHYPTWPGPTHDKLSDLTRSHPCKIIRPDPVRPVRNSVRPVRSPAITYPVLSFIAQH